MTPQEIYNLDSDSLYEKFMSVIGQFKVSDERKRAMLIIYYQTNEFDRVNEYEFEIDE